MYNPELVAPCGLYCGVCGIHHATVLQDEKLQQKMAKAYGVSPEGIHCRGCLSDQVFEYCRICPVKSCAAEKHYEGCYQCAEFPCEKIESFPSPEGKMNILRAVPRWRELGTEAWTKEEEALFTCKSCGSASFRGAKRCRKCGTDLQAPA